MLFKEELAQKIVDGVKTQTRRPIKAGEALVTIDGVKTVTQANGKRIKWQVGREYSIQYGRGFPTRYWHKAEGLMDWEFYQDALAQEKENFHKISGIMGWKPLRIKLVDVWAEDVRTISHADSVDEGLGSAEGFLTVWCEFYDPKLAGSFIYPQTFGEFLMEKRPAELYQAWALKFEVVK